MASTLVDQVVAFALNNLSLTGVVLGLLGLAIIERELVFAWLRASISGSRSGSSRSRSRSSTSASTSAGRRLVGLAVRVVTWIPRAVLRLLRGIVSIPGRLRVPTPSVSAPSAPSLPSAGGVVGWVLGGVKRALGGLWRGLRRAGASLVGILPQLGGAAAGAASSARGASDTVKRGAMLLAYLGGGVVLGWFAGGLLPV